MRAGGEERGCAPNMIGRSPPRMYVVEYLSRARNAMQCKAENTDVKHGHSLIDPQHIDIDLSIYLINYPQKINELFNNTIK